MQISKQIALSSLAIAMFASSGVIAEPDNIERLPGKTIAIEAPRPQLSSQPASVSTHASRADSSVHIERGKGLGFDTTARERVRGLIASHAAANGVPYKLADAVVRIESRYNARVSHGGALGLMQIKPQTARGVGFSGPANALYQPETNIRYGMKYLAGAYRLAGGDTCGTVMRYQSGHYAARMNGANRAYCAKARAIIARG